MPLEGGVQPDPEMQRPPVSSKSPLPRVMVYAACVSPRWRFETAQQRVAAAPPCCFFRVGGALGMLETAERDFPHKASFFQAKPEITLTLCVFRRRGSLSGQVCFVWDAQGTCATIPGPAHAMQPPCASSLPGMACNLLLFCQTGMSQH